MIQISFLVKERWVIIYKILLVDDEATERDGIRFLINKFDIPLKVSETANGKLAMEYLRENKTDILLTDIKMPHMDGLELARQARELYSDIKIIIFSAYGEFDYARQAMQAKAVNYLLKPIEVDEFVGVMQSVIAHCDEEKAQREKREALIGAGRKLLLLDLLNGTTEYSDVVASRLMEVELPLMDRYTSLVMLETTESYFPEHEEEFLRYLERSPYSLEYVNTYPNESYLILYDRKKPQTEDIRRFVKGVSLKMSEHHGAVVTAVISDTVRGVEKLHEEAQKIYVLRERLYCCDSQVLEVSEMAERDSFFDERLERVRKETSEVIDRGERSELRTKLGELAESLSDSRALNVVYAHHIFYDIISRVYARFGVYDPRVVHTKIRQLTECGDHAEIVSLMRGVVDDIPETSADQRDSAYAVKRILRIISNEYMKDLSLEYLASQVGFAPSYLSYVFKHETGENLIRYITNYRMEQAKKMLGDSSMRIVQIASECGYDNQSYFNRLFKNFYGMTPKQYREGLE